MSARAECGAMLPSWHLKSHVPFTKSTHLGLSPLHGVDAQDPAVLLKILLLVAHQLLQVVGAPPV